MEMPAEHNDKGKPAGPTAGFVRENSVKLAGVGQFIGDTALLAYGAAMKNFQIGSVGVLGYTAGTIGTRYGNPKVEKQLAIVERQLGNYLRQQGIEIPKDPTLEKLQKPGGVIEGVESFLYAHPTQLINTCFSLMGVQLFRDGLKNNIKPFLVSGALLTAGGLTGLLLKEKKPDPEHPPRGALQRAINWVQEKPLRTTGLLAMASPIALTIDGITERKRVPGKNSYMFKLMAAAGFFLCNAMISISSQGAGGGAEMDEATRNQLAEAAAGVIAAQPKEAQAQVITHVAEYMASQPYVHMNIDEIGAMLHKKLDEVILATPTGKWQQQLNTQSTEVNVGKS